jgi:hypothetical protein
MENLSPWEMARTSDSTLGMTVTSELSGRGNGLKRKRRRMESLGAMGTCKTAVTVESSVKKEVSS